MGVVLPPLYLYGLIISMQNAVGKEETEPLIYPSFKFSTTSDNNLNISRMIHFELEPYCVVTNYKRSGKPWKYMFNAPVARKGISSIE